jgi:hypothetical protein
MSKRPSAVLETGRIIIRASNAGNVVKGGCDDERLWRDKRVVIRELVDNFVCRKIFDICEEMIFVVVMSI